MPNTAQQWAAFTALVPYFSACPASPKIRDQLLAIVRQCEQSVLSRETLVLRAGLSLFADDFNIDLALMQFVREDWLVPIADGPFTFALNLHPSNATERCLPSLPKQAGGE